MPSKHSRKLWNLDPVIVRHKRHVERKTLDEVAADLGCSVMTISRFCREHQIEHPVLERRLTLDLTGRRFGFLKVLEPLPKRSHCCCIIWRCRCVAPGCDKVVERASNTLMHGAKTNQSCGCYVHVHNYRGIGDLSGSYYNAIRRGAESRGLEFSLTKEYLWELFEHQKRQCALSGVVLKLSRGHRRGGRREQTGSVDRIDSSKGYVEGNVQWIHKQLQFMKSNLSDETFIDWCGKIVAFHPVEPTLP